MELKITLYEDRLCRKVKDVKTAPDFGLSTLVCEEVLNAVNIDMLASGGLSALSDESKLELFLPIVKEGLPYFKELLAEIFEVSIEEMGYTDLTEIVTVIVQVVIYSFKKMKPLAESGKNSKN